MSTRETVTILRPSPGGWTAEGDPVPSTESSTAVTGCIVAPNGSTEGAERGREGVVTGWVIYAPTGTDVLPTDFMTVRGVRCRVEGEIGVWLGTRAGVVINVKRAVG